MTDVPGRLQIGGTFEESMPLLNQVLDSLDGENRTKIIRNGPTPTILFGYQPDGFGGLDYGLKVAKPGVDVTTATNDQLAFNSAFDNFKIVQKGTLTFNIVGGDYQEVTANHGLSYTPGLVAYVSPVSYQNSDTGHIMGGRKAGAHYPTPYYAIDNSTFVIDGFIAVYTTPTQVVGQFMTNHPDFDGTYTITYYLLQETAN